MICIGLLLIWLALGSAVCFGCRVMTGDPWLQVVRYGAISSAVAITIIAALGFGMYLLIR